MSHEMKEYGKFATGIFLVRADNANFNADFANFPRRLPDEGATIYATDKALKYCIRKYWHDFGETVLMWRRFYKDGKDSGKPQDLEDSIKELTHLEKLDDKKKTAHSLLQKCIDMRVFGGTIPVKDGNVSLTGPCQITYGVDCFNAGEVYVSQIQSPKPTKKGKDQFTLGQEVRATEVHYAYDFTINPNNLLQDEFLKSAEINTNPECVLSQDDVRKLKVAITRGVNYVTSTTKTGAIGELLLFAEFEKKDGEVPFVPLLKNKVRIEVDKGKRTIHLSDVVEAIVSLNPISIEVYHDPNISEIDLGKHSGRVKKFNILSHKEI